MRETLGNSKNRVYRDQDRRRKNLFVIMSLAFALELKKAPSQRSEMISRISDHSILTWKNVPISVFVRIEWKTSRRESRAVAAGGRAIITPKFLIWEEREISQFMGDWWSEAAENFNSTNLEFKFKSIITLSAVLAGFLQSRNMILEIRDRLSNALIGEITCVDRLRDLQVLDQKSAGLVC